VPLLWCRRESHLVVALALHAPLYGPPVLGSSLILLFEENETCSPVAFVAELAPGKIVALDNSTAVTPTMSKTVKIRISSVHCLFVHLALAS
jgi:hypothetical protein